MSRESDLAAALELALPLLDRLAAGPQVDPLAVALHPTQAARDAAAAARAALGR